MKSRELWPSDQRYTIDENGIRRQTHAVAYTYYRKDLEAEIDYAMKHQIPCHLVVVNLRNGNEWSVQIDPYKFQSMTTPPALSEGESQEEQEYRFEPPGLEELLTNA